MHSVYVFGCVETGSETGNGSGRWEMKGEREEELGVWFPASETRKPEVEILQEMEKENCHSNKPENVIGGFLVHVGVIRD